MHLVPSPHDLQSCRERVPDSQGGLTQPGRRQTGCGSTGPQHSAELSSQQCHVSLFVAKALGG